jgi:hypothetical protein
MNSRLSLGSARLWQIHACQAAAPSGTAFLMKDRTMKKLIIAAVVAIAAAGQADARPVSALNGWYQGSWTCTIANSPKQKLFMTLSANGGRAAVREYPYYGQTQYKQLVRGSRFSVGQVSFHGQGRLTFRQGSTPGVMTGSGRIGFQHMFLTCAKS